jgi:hypothetical protein
MTTILNYLTAFWSVVIVNCAHPQNWEACYRIDQWLIPEVIEGVSIYLDKDHSHLYKSEREYLKTIKN